jgi:hypothetical protein
MPRAVIFVATVHCGADDLTPVEGLGKARVAWVHRFLEMENGIPSQKIFGRVFALLSQKVFPACCLGWI